MNASNKVQIQPVLRGWTKSSIPQEPRDYRPRNPYRPVDHLCIVFDTETTVDASQRLRFGAFAIVYVKADSSMDIIERGLFMADEPASGDAHAASVMETYCHDMGLRFIPSTQQFCERYLWKYAAKQNATVVCANMLFDISRIAVRAVESRKKDNGFTFYVFRDSNGTEYGGRLRPQVIVKKLGAHKNATSWGSTEVKDKKSKRGKFVDVLQAVSAHNGGMPYSLGACAKLYGTKHQKTEANYSGEVTPEYLGYCVNDVEVTAEVYEAVLKQHMERKSGTPLDKVFSTASLSKGLMDDMGVVPPLTANPDFPATMLGLCMAAFIGARTEAHTVNVPVPGQLLDFTSMYPTCGSLMDLTRFLRCESIRVEDCTEDVRRLLASISLEKCFDRKMWPQFCGLATVRPGVELTVPVRADYGSSGTQVSVSHFTPAETIPYAIPDLVAACLLDETPPEIVQAWRIVPEGKSPFVRKAKLPDGMALDIRYEDLFRTLVERRNGYKERNCKGHGGELTCITETQCDKCSVSLYLKILANALYGIFAEMNPEKARYKDKMYHGTIGSTHVKTWKHKESWTAFAHDKPETPGRFCFPPLAMLFTSGARLMLAMLECLSGDYAMMDTDSMFLAATLKGGTLHTDGVDIECLSYDQVEEVAERFQELSPYSLGDSGIRLLKKEYPKNENEKGWCLAISSKRYCLFLNELDGIQDVEIIDSDNQDDYFRVDKRSEHGLGYLKSPADGWKDEAWRWIIANKIRGMYDESIPKPEWFDYPAVGQHTISSPWLLDAFKGHNEGKTYQDQVKPGNFMMVGYQPISLKPKGQNVRLIAPFFTEISEALEIPWFDLHSRHGVKVSLGDTDSADVVEMKTYGAIMHEYLRHAEVKAGTQDGTQASTRTKGVLHRLTLEQKALAKVQGRESNQREEQGVHLVSEPETTTVYKDVKKSEIVSMILRNSGLDPSRPDGEDIAVMKAMDLAVNHGFKPGNATVALIIAGELIRDGHE